MAPLSKLLLSAIVLGVVAAEGVTVSADSEQSISVTAFGPDATGFGPDATGFAGADYHDDEGDVFDYIAGELAEGAADYEDSSPRELTRRGLMETIRDTILRRSPEPGCGPRGCRGKFGYKREAEADPGSKCGPRGCRGKYGT